MKFTHIACIAVLLASLILQSRCSKFHGLLAKSRRARSIEETKPTTPATPEDVQGNVTQGPGDDIPEVIVNVAPPDKSQIKPNILQEQIRHKKSPFCVQVPGSPYGAHQTVCNNNVAAGAQGQHVLGNPGMMAGPVQHLAQAAFASAAFGTAAHSLYNPPTQPSGIGMYHPSGPSPDFSFQPSGPAQKFGHAVNAPFIPHSIHNAQPSYHNVGSYRSSEYGGAPVIQSVDPSFQFQTPFDNQLSPHNFGAPPQPQFSPHNFAAPPQPSYGHPAPHPAAYNTQAYGHPAPSHSYAPPPHHNNPASYNAPSYGDTHAPHSYPSPPQHIPTSYNSPSYGNAPSSHVYAAPPHHVQASYNAPSYGNAPPSHSFSQSAQSQHASQSFNAASIGGSHAASGSQFNAQPQSSYGSYQSQHSYTTTSYPPPFYGNPNDMAGPQSYASAGTETYRDAESDKKDKKQKSDDTTSKEPPQAPRDSHYNTAPAMYQRPHHGAPAYSDHKYAQPTNEGSNYGHNSAPSYNPSHHTSSSSTPHNFANSAASFNSNPSFGSEPVINFEPSAPYFNFPAELPFNLNNQNYPIFENQNNIPYPFNPIPFSPYAPQAPFMPGAIFGQGAIQPFNLGAMANNDGSLCTAYGPGSPTPLRIMCHVQPLDAAQTPINALPPSYRDDNAPKVQVGSDKDKKVTGKDDEGSSSSDDVPTGAKAKAEVTTSSPGDPRADSEQAVNNQTNDQAGDASKARQSSQVQSGKPMIQGLQQGSMNSQLGRPINPIGRDGSGQSGQPGSQGRPPVNQGDQMPGQPGQLFSQQNPKKPSLGLPGTTPGQSGQPIGQSSGARAAYGGWAGIPSMENWNIAPHPNRRVIRYPSPPFPQFGPEYY